jgi:hypothetical protein
VWTIWKSNICTSNDRAEWELAEKSFFFFTQYDWLCALGNLHFDSILDFVALMSFQV